MTDVSAIVASYRSHLEKWGIRPARVLSEAFASLSNRLFEEYIQIAKRETDDEVFYEWITDRRRLGAVHSIKWAEILTSGVWAHLVLREFCPTGRVLDAGCNAGYWTTWEAGSREGEVLGIDQAGGVIEIGRQRIKATGLKGRVEVSSYGEAGSFGEFDAVVSLQGITRYLTHGDFAQLRSLCSLVATGGHLLLVERPPESNRELDACLRDMGLGLIGVGNAGGMCINSDFGSYLCLLLKKGESSSVGILEAEEESVRLWENHFKVFANRDLGIDWTLRNWAYCWAEGAPYLRRFE